MLRRKKVISFVTVAALAASLTVSASSSANAAWSLATAAKPYKGITIHLPFLDRPGYKAAIKMIPAFTKQTGIKVTYDIIPYESTLQKLTLDFTGGKAAYDGVLSDVVWIGNFGASGWMVPLSKFTSNAALADPALNLKGFFPILLDSFGTWNKVLYGLPFDNYAGVMFYNKCMLKDAGFTTPPKTYIKNGGVSGRMAVYKDEEVAKSGLFGPMVESWQKYGNAVFRPRFPEWPAMSEEIAAVGTDMQSGKISIKDGTAKLDASVLKILTDAGYYSGKKPKLQ